MEKRHPEIAVGIMSGTILEFSFSGRYKLPHLDWFFEGDLSASLEGETIRLANSSI